MQEGVTSGARTTVLYDGSCPLCTAEIGLYRDRDGEGRLHLVDVSAPGAALPQGLDREAAMARFHVIAPDGQVLSGAAAFIEVWRGLPGWRWLARPADLPGVEPVLEVTYRAFLKVRPAMVRLFVAVKRF
jgi:predicted DCC family thiol-disulfide oxidoreductase YuxK